jgi:hypothetical protein
VIASGDRLTFDGVTYAVLDIGPGGDSEANAVGSSRHTPDRLSRRSHVDGTHSYTADGHLLAWLANLSMVERLCAGWTSYSQATAPPRRRPPN